MRSVRATSDSTSAANGQRTPSVIRLGEHRVQAIAHRAQRLRRQFALAHPVRQRLVGDAVAQLRIGRAEAVEQAPAPASRARRHRRRRSRDCFSASSCSDGSSRRAGMRPANAGGPRRRTSRINVSDRSRQTGRRIVLASARASGATMPSRRRLSYQSPPSAVASTATRARAYACGAGGRRADEHSSPYRRCPTRKPIDPYDKPAGGWDALTQFLACAARAAGAW